MSELFSIHDCASLLEVEEYRITYAHRKGVLPEPTHVAGKRIYTEGDLQTVADYFGRQLKPLKEDK